MKRPDPTYSLSSIGSRHSSSVSNLTCTTMAMHVSAPSTHISDRNSLTSIAEPRRMRIVIPSDHQTLVTCDIHNAIILQQKKSACVRVLRRGTDIQTDMLLIGVETEVIASVNKTSVYPVGIVWGGGNGSAVGK